MGLSCGFWTGPLGEPVGNWKTRKWPKNHPGDPELKKKED